ncbi:MAG: UDP-2-acetamido-2-deoxy-ribo-hexuluronate aminotransferase [Cognaticolwellia sp.]|jgi:dTDP-4-amino-4,6-dideoxygalactose transaminase
MNIQMVDLKTQYEDIKIDVNKAILECVGSTWFIGGPNVQAFKQNLADYLGANHVIPCANGTDALQIAMMALGLKAGDEVILPAFTYVATAEVIALLGLKPVMVDVDMDTFNIKVDAIEAVITPKTRAIVPVHLFGQVADMEAIMKIAEKHNLFVIEDNAQAIGADYTFSDGTIKKAGTIGHIGCTSFYPSKNLGCYGDGGAIFTNDEAIAGKIQMVANHGQSRRYYHDEVGVNSRLDAIQAVVLNIKLPLLDGYCERRNKAANFYDAAFANIDGLITPKRAVNSTHVFHQYTLRIENGKRDELAEYLKEKNVPNMIYYPVPLYKQLAYAEYSKDGFELQNTEILSDAVLSLPMHSELPAEQLEYITKAVISFFLK